MKFYLIEISEGDAKIAGKAIYEYETRSEAIANFHTKLGSAMSSELYASEQVIVINSENGIEAEEKYVTEVLKKGLLYLYLCSGTISKKEREGYYGN